jgi:prepilin-type N-terminal cleavage/methylation domain-containing protein
MLGTDMSRQTQKSTSIHLNEKGFTLIEVVICMGIFAIGIMGVLTTQVATMRGNESTHEMTRASSWTDTHIEALLASPFDDPNLAAGAHQQVRDGFTINWDVNDRDMNADGNTDLKEVQVLVNVPSPGNRKTLRLFFIVSPDG